MSKIFLFSRKSWPCFASDPGKCSYFAFLSDHANTLLCLHQNLREKWWEENIRFAVSRLFKWSEKKWLSELNKTIICTSVYAALFWRVLCRYIVDKYRCIKIITEKKKKQQTKLVLVFIHQNKPNQLCFEQNWIHLSGKKIFFTASRLDLNLNVGCFLSVSVVCYSKKKKYSYTIF